MPKYTIKKGYEHIVISEQGVRRLSESEVESDHELNSPLLTLVQDETAQVQPQPQVNAAPAAPVVSQPAVQTPVAPVAPAPAAQPVVAPTQNQGGTN